MIARARFESRYTEEAIRMYDEIIETQIRVLAIDHVDTLDALFARADTYSRLGRREKAVELYEELKNVQSRVFGWHDSITNETVKALVASYKDS
jgi:tetratricopeptide (TPR) repeat protein